MVRLSNSSDFSQRPKTECSVWNRSVHPKRLITDQTRFGTGTEPVPNWFCSDFRRSVWTTEQSFVQLLDVSKIGTVWQPNDLTTTQNLNVQISDIHCTLNKSGFQTSSFQTHPGTQGTEIWILITKVASRFWTSRIQTVFSVQNFYGCPDFKHPL